MLKHGFSVAYTPRHVLSSVLIALKKTFIYCPFNSWLTFVLRKNGKILFDLEGILVRDTKEEGNHDLYFTIPKFVGWLVGCFGFNRPFRQYFSLYRAVSQREGDKRRERIDESKNVQTTPTRTYCKRSRPLPYYYSNCRTPQHWKVTQHHRTTRPPLRNSYYGFQN